MGVEDVVKDFWASRPRRPRSGKVVAGVAAGIGRRYAVDPVIVRVALVVSAVYGGAGLVCYLLGWLLLPGEEDQVSPIESLFGRGHSGTSRGLTIILCILLIPAVNFTFGGHYSTIAGLILLFCALFLLHRYRGHLGTGTPTATMPTNTMPTNTMPTAGMPTADLPSTAAGEQPTVRDSVPTDEPRDAVPTERTEPPAWDPLGAASFAWDLPEPTPEPRPAPPPAPRRPRVGLATLGIVLVTGATLIALSGQGGWLTPPHIVGLLAAITAVGLLVGAVLHAGRGLIPLAVVLSAASFGLTATHFDGFHGAGDATFRPTTVAAVQPLYQRSIGDIDLDLTALPPSGTVHTRVKLGVGDVTVHVPADATVRATCRSGVGDVTCLDQRSSGPGSTVHATQQGTGSGLTIVLDVQDGPGDVRVIDNG